MPITEQAGRPILPCAGSSGWSLSKRRQSHRQALSIVLPGFVPTQEGTRQITTPRTWRGDQTMVSRPGQGASLGGAQR